MWLVCALYIMWPCRVSYGMSVAYIAGLAVLINRWLQALEVLY
jgi:hypothetical protein